MINTCIFLIISYRSKRLQQINVFFCFGQPTKRHTFISLFAIINNRQIIACQMTQNLQHKNEQLRALCKKQQAQIAKLQSEIRERYQSFYLHSSRYKKGQINPSQSNQNAQRPIKSYSEIPKANERLYSQQPPQKSKTEIIEEFISTKTLGLALKHQFQFLIEPTKQERNKELNEMAITIESFKGRISALQNNKNQAVKQIEKYSNQIKQLRAKVSSLQKNVEFLSKSQKKLKDKLKKLPQYEQKIDQIYIKLMKEVKKQEFNEWDQLQKHFNYKMQEIIKWISQSKQKVDGLLEDFNQIESSQNQASIQAPEATKTLQVVSVFLPPPQNVQEEKLETITSPEFSPMKTSSKIIPQNWTIISKINEVDIKPFDASEVKSYNFPSETSNRKEEEESIIKVLQQNSMIEQQLNQTKKEYNELKQELTINRSKNNRLAQELKNSVFESNKYKEELDDKFKDLLKDLQESRRKNDTLYQQLNTNTVQINRLKEELNHEKAKKNKLKEELENSPKLSELQYSSLAKEVQTLKELHEKSKLNITQPDLTTSKMTINQQLQAPYFVEEDLQTNPNDEYVKRSFIRKKIVRRNLSATAYRIVSKSKQEVQEIVAKKINDYRDISREKADKLKASEKKDKVAKQESLQNSVNRISEVSEPRYSGINHEQVRILEVTTTTLGQEIKSAKIYTKGGQSNLSTRRKY